MTNAIKVLLQMQSGFLQLESTTHIYLLFFCLVFLVIFLFSMHFFFSTKTSDSVVTSGSHSLSNHKKG
jgi:hypothetical protein